MLVNFFQVSRAFGIPQKNICISLVLVFFTASLPPPPNWVWFDLLYANYSSYGMHIFRQFPLFPPQGGNRFDSWILLQFKICSDDLFYIFFITMCGGAVQNKCIMLKTYFSLFFFPLFVTWVVLLNSIIYCSLKVGEQIYAFSMVSCFLVLEKGGYFHYCGQKMGANSVLVNPY